MLEILQGDWVERLRELPAERVQCCVTSPPYWGLRDYGTATWDGGLLGCSHEPPQEWIDHNFNANSGFGKGAKTQSAGAKGRWYNSDGSCRCGAKRIDAQLGLEKTPDEYVAKMVAGFREVRRVLKRDGTCWVNLGDSYANDTKWGGSTGGKHVSALHNEPIGRSKRFTGLKGKDLVGIPWMVAFALRDDGWYLRSDIIWHKPNPMPESVTDRPTKSHEYIFLLTKSQRYFYDAEAILEPVSPNTNMRLSQNLAAQIGSYRANGGSKTNGPMKAVGRKASQGENGVVKHNASFDASVCLPVTERNKRTVWTVTTQGYPDAHFATYPPDLIKPCILAGSRNGDTVLDPFGGSGTTGMVAIELGRKAILCELNPAYVSLIRQRCDVTPGLAL